MRSRVFFLGTLLKLKGKEYAKEENQREKEELC